MDVVELIKEWAAIAIACIAVFGAVVAVLRFAIRLDEQMRLLIESVKATNIGIQEMDSRLTKRIDGLYERWPSPSAPEPIDQQAISPPVRSPSEA